MVVYFRKIVERVERHRKLVAMQVAIADYEAENGEITEEELMARRQADREASIKVRGRVPDELQEYARRLREEP
jgi:hypothetical protein